MVNVRTKFTLALTLALAAVPALYAQTYPSTSDPRSGLKVGRLDAGVAASGMRLVSFTPKAAEFDSTRGLTFVNSDLAFRGNYVYQGNFSGFSIWDVSNPAKPVIAAVYPCVTSQGDPSIYGNLLFISAEGGGNRNDCAKGGVQDLKDGMQGVRIFDVSNPRNPRLVKNVQTCKGSHTHTVVPSPADKGVVYIYVSGSGGARPDSVVTGSGEAARTFYSPITGCKSGTDPADETNSMYRLDVIKVPLANPAQAEVVTGARIFTGMTPAPRGAGRGARGGGGRGGAAAGDTAGGRAGRGGRGAGGAGAGAAGAAVAGAAAPPPQYGPRNCHDVTSYPAMNLLAGACGSYGLLVDISNPERPVRLDAASDTNFSLWHTATFSNDGSKVVFTDEWGGGTGPMCQATSMIEAGGNTILTIGPDKKLKKHAYFKLPAAQTAQENCVSHNGSLVPVPGRDLMVQGWYQGGVNVFDFTDPDRPFEVAFFDRGPIDAPPPPPPPPTPVDTVGGRGAGLIVDGRIGGGGRGGGRGGGGGSTTGGSWGAYWYNGYIYSSELARGLDILELTPSDKLSANEIAAAKLVRWEEFNPQAQPKIVWPAAFPVVRSYLDQLVRNNGLAAARTTAIANALNAAERQTGAARATALTTLARQVHGDMAGSRDSARVHAMATAIEALAAASR
jgi:hypothetical protein